MLVRAEVAGDRPEVAENGPGRPEPPAAASDADVETVAQDDVGPPEGQRHDRHRRERHQRGAEVPPPHQHEEHLRADEEYGVGMSRQHEDERGTPGGEAPWARFVERAQEREERDQAREEKEAVHAAEDAVEEEHPTGRSERGCDDAREAIGEPRPELGDQRDACDREDEGDDAQRRQAAAELDDGPGKQEMERRAASLRNHRVQHVAERTASDEEREGLVLVRRPGAQEPAEHAGNHRRHRARCNPEGVELECCDGEPGLFLERLQADTAASVFHSHANL